MTAFCVLRGFCILNGIFAHVQREEREKKHILNCSHIVGLYSSVPARLELWAKSCEKRDLFKNGEAFWKHTNVPKKEKHAMSCLTSYSCGQPALWNAFLHKFLIGSFISLSKYASEAGKLDIYGRIPWLSSMEKIREILGNEFSLSSWTPM